MVTQLHQIKCEKANTCTVVHNDNCFVENADKWEFYVGTCMPGQICRNLSGNIWNKKGNEPQFSSFNMQIKNVLWLVGQDPAQSF